MIASVVVAPNTVDGKWRATWLATHSSSGIQVSGYGDPIAALRGLADELERADERQAAVNRIDSGDDD